ncbi:MAG: hypothetical protein AAF320_00775 [Myxococcota bacterium]
MVNTKNSKKRSLISFKDCQIVYLLEGIPGIKKLVHGRKNAGPVLRRTLKELKEAGRKTDALEKFVAESYPTGTRGRSSPTVWQKRQYKAQQLTEGDAFLRLPLGPLGAHKGDFVEVLFEPNRIVVQSSSSQNLS